MVVVLAYSNSLRVPFVFDDELNILRNPIVHDLALFVAPWKLDPALAPPALVHGFHSRYPAFLTFALDWAVHGSDVLGYHLVNLAIHLGALLVLLALVRAVLGLPRFDGSRVRGHETPIALLVGALFSLHPLQTQAVTYIVQRMTSLAALLCLISLLAYVRARSCSPGAKRRVLAIGCLAALVVAMATKQNAFVFPVVLIVAELVLFRSDCRTRMTWLAIPMTCVLFVAPTLYVWPQHAAGLAAHSPETEASTLLLKGSDYRITQLRVLVTYLRLFVLPVNQTLDYDYPVSRSWVEPAVLGSGILLAGLFATGVWLSVGREGRDPAWRLVGFGLVWFFVMHAVESSGIEALDPIFEHRMYLPSVGLCLALVVASFVGLPPRMARAGMAGLASVALVLGCATYARNQVWKSELRLWKDVVEKSPLKARAWMGVGERLLELRRADEAERHYLRAHELEPNNAAAIVQLGVVARIQRDDRRAEELFLRVLELEPRHWLARVNLGDISYGRGDRSAAERFWEEAAEVELLTTFARRRLERLRAGLDPGNGSIQPR